MKSTNRLRCFLKKYSHAWVLLYAFIYMPWFLYLENRTNVHYYIIHSPVDKSIPFLEIFIIPYLIWCVFIAATALYLFFTDKTGFYKLAAFLITGMTIFLIICTVFPNGLNLRPTVFPRDNVSIAIAHSQSLKKHPYIQKGAYILAGLIILSTMFLKQHSVTDVTAAIVLALIVYPFVYVTQTKKAPKLSHQPI